MLLAILLLSMNLYAEQMQCEVISGPFKGQEISIESISDQLILYDRTNTRLMCTKSADSENQAVNLNCGEGFFQSAIQILPDGMGSITTMKIESKLRCEKSTYLSLKVKNSTKVISR